MNFRKVGRDPRQLHQRQWDRIGRHGRNVPVSRQELGDFGSADEVARQIQVERRQRQCLVADNLDGGATTAESHDRAKGRIVGNAEDRFTRGPTHDHRLNHDAVDARLRLRPHGSPDDRFGGITNLVLGGKAKHDAADIRLMRNISGQDLHRNGLALGDERLCPSNSILGVACCQRGHDRDRIGRKQAGDFDWIEPGSIVLQGALNDLSGSADARCEQRRHIRRGGHQRVHRLAMPDQIRKRPHRVVLGLEVCVLSKIGATVRSVPAHVASTGLFTKCEQATDVALATEAKSCFELALRLITRSRPSIVAIGGMFRDRQERSGARHCRFVAAGPGAIVIRTDVIRKELFGVDPLTPLPKEAYQADITERVYRTMF